MYSNQYKFRFRKDKLIGTSKEKNVFLDNSGNNFKNKSNFLETTKYYASLFHGAIANYDFIDNAIKELLRNKGHKKIYKKTMKMIDKKSLDLNRVLPKQKNKPTDILLFLYPVLGLKALDAYDSTDLCGDKEKLNKWLQDKDFKVFYKKVLLVFLIIKNKRIAYAYSNKDLADKTMFLFSIEGILLVYFIKNFNKDIGNEEIKSFFSKVLNWEEFNVEFSVAMNLEQEKTMKEVRTGIKYEILQKFPTRVNNISHKSKDYNVLEDMTNNIRVKYISGKDGKHKYHDSPIIHWREGHWRHYKNGTIVWIKGNMVGGKKGHKGAA